MTQDASPPSSPPNAPTREKLAALLTRLRGSVSTAEVARRLPPGAGSTRETASRQAVMELERGWHQRRVREGEEPRWFIANPTLERLEELGRVYGVVFEIVARDPDTGAVIFQDAPGLRRPPAASP